MNVIDPRWPDKMRAAASLAALAGGLGLAWALLSHFVVVDPKLPAIFGRATPFTVLASLAALTLGIASRHWQRRRYVALGAVAAIVSGGALGVATMLGALSLLALRQGQIEREQEMAYPAHAMLASVYLATGAAITGLYGLLMLTGRWEANGPMQPALSVVGALVAGAAALLAYHVRFMPVALAGSAILIMAGGFYVLGPLIGMLAAWQVIQAMRHHEPLRTQLVRVGATTHYG